MRLIDFSYIIKDAWQQYNPKRGITSIVDISARVSTNHVFRLKLENGDFVIAKLSYFGEFDHFVEDHTIINALATNLLSPYDNFIAKSLTKKNQLFTYRHKDEFLDAWVVFYNPITVKEKPPQRFEENHIIKLAGELAGFHKACSDIIDILPDSSKTLSTDINHLLEILETEEGKFEHRMNEGEIKRQCDLFLKNTEALNYESLEKIPVFVDWNIGNFSVDENFEFYSRWDYDWFRMASRVLDFYFFSRVVSDIGDKTTFSYYINPMTEPRFMLFLKEYHKVFPLTELEIRMMPEAYRFFILNYVIKDGRYFFHEIYASKLQKEAYDIYLPSLVTGFDADRILKELGI